MNQFFIILVLAIHLAVLIILGIIKHANVAVLPPVQNMYSVRTI